MWRVYCTVSPGTCRHVKATGPLRSAGRRKPCTRRLLQALNEDGHCQLRLCEWFLCVCDGREPFLVFILGLLKRLLNLLVLSTDNCVCRATENANVTDELGVQLVTRDQWCGMPLSSTSLSAAVQRLSTSLQCYVDIERILFWDTCLRVLQSSMNIGLAPRDVYSYPVYSPFTKKIRGLCPLSNYTDRATAACRGS
jgi:hypothetical protein